MRYSYVIISWSTLRKTRWDYTGAVQPPWVLTNARLRKFILNKESSGKGEAASILSWETFVEQEQRETSSLLNSRGTSIQIHKGFLFAPAAVIGPLQTSWWWWILLTWRSSRLHIRYRLCVAELDAADERPKEVFLSFILHGWILYLWNHTFNVHTIVEVLRRSVYSQVSVEIM